MWRLVFLLLLPVHGLIHLMGFAKAFHLTKIEQLTREITKPAGVLWLTAGLLFVFTAILLLFRNEQWWIPGVLAVVSSQVLIVSAWGDAKMGTVANVVLLLGCIAGFGKWQFERQYRCDVQASLSGIGNATDTLVTERDLKALPAPVQRYLRYAGVLNKPRVKCMRVVMDGRMREKGKEWFPFTSEQYNFYQDPTRLFFMKGRMFGMTVPGYHRYQRVTATMDVRLIGLYSVIRVRGAEMNKAETVTLFNDMCLMAPATLIDERIAWQAINDTSAKATFTNGAVSISATLFFNKAGQLINFVSEDRYAVAEMQQYLFATPIEDYVNMNGYMLGSRGKGIWYYPDGAFTYGEFNIRQIEYNLKPGKSLQ